MAESSKGQIVLVTGINGYIASVIGLALLEKGYTLRGTARAVKSTAPLLEGGYEKYASQVEIVEVPNMEIAGAFDTAVKGVHAIIHAASPVNINLTNPDDVIKPAVQGTVGILESAAAHAGPQLKSICVMSSLAAVNDAKFGPTSTITEANWASTSAEKVAASIAAGTTVGAETVYGASKIAAEKAIWKFRDEHKPPFAITAVNPSVTIGPPVELPSSPSKLNFTLQMPWDLFSGVYKDQPVPPTFGSGAGVDVRDVARISIWIIENPAKVDGERFIASAYRAPNQAVVDVLREAYPARRDLIPEGTKGEGYLPGYRFLESGKKVDGSKAEKLMGFKYITLDKSVKDMAKVFEKFLEQ